MAAAAAAQPVDEWRIETVAGTSDVGDGGPAVQAPLYIPQGLAVDSAGNLYIADWFNERIRKVDASTGVISTVAGTGERGYSGDGGPAVEAQLNNPSGVAVDSSGNLYISNTGYSSSSCPSDCMEGRIRKVDASTGVISTVAGTGENGYSGDGGPADAAQLNSPRGVAADGAGNIYIADTFNQRIRKVGTTGLITTVAGNGTPGSGGDGGPADAAQLNHPYGVALDGAGNIYIADSSNNRIRKVDAAGVISTVAGTGEAGYNRDGSLAVQAQLSFPTDVAVDPLFQSKNEPKGGGWGAAGRSSVAEVERGG